MKRWYVGHSRDDWEQRRAELPLPAATAEEILDRTCAATGHRLCGYGWGDFAWSLPAGWPRFDDKGQLDNAIPEVIQDTWMGIHKQLVHRFEDGELRETERDND